jgi:hypothetical protein
LLCAFRDRLAAVASELLSSALDHAASDFVQDRGRHVAMDPDLTARFCAAVSEWAFNAGVNRRGFDLDGGWLCCQRLDCDGGGRFSCVVKRQVAV